MEKKKPSRVRVAEKEHLLKPILTHLRHLSDDDVDVYYNRALHLLQSKLFDDACSVFQVLVAARPEEERNWVGLGTTLHYLKCYDEALHAYILAITLNPFESKNYVHATACCLELDAIQTALNLINSALVFVEKYPSHPNTEKLKLDLTVARQYVLHYRK